MARRAPKKPAPDAPGVIVYTFRQWPLFPYFNEIARLPESLHDRGCYLYPVYPDQPMTLFERHPEPRLSSRVARAGLRINWSLYHLHRDETLRALTGDPDWAGSSLRYGFHASEGVDVVRAAFVRDGFRVVDWDGWSSAEPAPFSDLEVGLFCDAADPSALQAINPGDERGNDRHGELRKVLAARGMSKGAVLAASLAACDEWPSFRAWVRTRATRLDGTVERLMELPARGARARSVRALFAELATTDVPALDVRPVVRKWMEQRLRVPAMRRVLAPSAPLYGL